jgi:hypothetical protein
MPSTYGRLALPELPGVAVHPRSCRDVRNTKAAQPRRQGPSPLQLLIIATYTRFITTPPKVIIKPRNLTDLVENKHLLALQKSPYYTS